jgi:hypothetical protein
LVVPRQQERKKEKRRGKVSFRVRANALTERWEKATPPPEVQCKRLQAEEEKALT